MTLMDDLKRSLAAGPDPAAVSKSVPARAAFLPPLRKVTQSILYSPGNEARGIYGNCLQAAIASALDMELEAVPNFAAFCWWDCAARLWLRGTGYDWLLVPPPVPAERSVVVGRSPRNTGLHAVVGEDGGVAWDPHPDRTGLIEVKHSYVLAKWPTAEPSACVACGRI